MSSPAASAGYQAMLQQAESAAAGGDNAQAIALYQAMRVQWPRDAHLLVQLSYVHSLAGQYRLARQCALDAHALGPSPPKVLAELLKRLRTFNEGQALQDCVQRLLPASRMPIPLLLAVAAQLTYLNLPEQAIGFLDEARRADPDYPPTRLTRAQVLIYLGRFDEAREDLACALARAPQIAQGWWLLAGLPRQDAQAHHIQAIRAQLARPGLRPDERVLLEFALHKELDELGDTAGAWQALQRGCQAKRAHLRYSLEDTTQLFAGLHAVRPDHGHAAGSALSLPQAPVPVFIVGMHRSGTTLLEQLLAGSAHVDGLGELYDFTSAMRQATDHHCRGVIDPILVQRANAADLHQAGQHYLHSVGWRLSGRSVFTDKLPSNFLNLGFIAQALPQARILHMVRDPMETCFSNLRELFSDANPYSYDQAELADWHNRYRRLMAHWHACFPGRILDVAYADLVADPAATLQQVCTFTGIAYDPAMARPGRPQRGIVTASAVQARAAIQARATPKWHAYRAALRPLAAALEP